jgi:IclR family acetate operon transcriptional repressor
LTAPLAGRVTRLLRAQGLDSEMRERVKESNRHVEAVLKALEVLDCFQVNPLLPLKKISELTGMNKSRIIRLCGTLLSRGYLIYDSEAQNYRLGFKVLSLGKAYERSNNLLSFSRPILRNLADQTGESASLFVMDGLQRLCLAREEGTFSIRYNILEGQRMVLYAGAGGKVLLAFGPDELCRKVLSRNHLRKLTPTTIQEPKQLEKELETVRRQGYASSYGERDPDVAALAAPIYTHDGKVCAALSIAGPINRFSKEHNVKHLEILLASAERLSAILGYECKKPSIRNTEKKG